MRVLRPVLLLLTTYCSFRSSRAAPSPSSQPQDDIFKKERAIATKFKINPKQCRVERESEAGVCMFNYECYKQKGTVLGTCIDGFLFGACCRLPSADDAATTTTSSSTTTTEVVVVVDNFVVSSRPTAADSEVDSPQLMNSIKFGPAKTNASAVTSQSEWGNASNTIYLDRLDLPAPPPRPPAIILGNGSVVSLGYISGGSASKPISTTDSGLSPLSTWFAVDSNNPSSTTASSTAKTTTAKTTKAGTTTKKTTTTKTAASSATTTTKFTTTTSTTTTISTTSTTTTTESQSTTSLPATTELVTTSSAATTTSNVPTEGTAAVKTSSLFGDVFTTHPPYSIPFLELSDQITTLRPQPDSENVNAHLDGFVNSILASINQSKPELLNTIPTEPPQETPLPDDPFEWIEKWEASPAPPLQQSWTIINSVKNRYPATISPVHENTIDVDDVVPKITTFSAPVKEVTTSTTTTTTPATTTITTTTTSTTTTTTTTTTVTTTTTESTSTTTVTSTTTKKWDYQKDCGVRPLRGQGRIVGGEKSAFGDWPWQVLIKERSFLGLFLKNKCGGVLVSDRHVLTAAHCQPGLLASLLVELGEYDISGPTEYMSTKEKAVKRVVIHKDYKAPTFENDLAILELEEPIERQPHVVPICMPRDDAGDFLGRVGIVSGWGRLEYGGSVPNILHQVSVPVISNDDCQEMFVSSGHRKTIRESFLCAGYPEGKRDSCEGDSGGPLMWQGEDGRWVLMGTVSHGIKCAYPNLPGVYMRMTYYKEWIEKVAGIKFDQ